MSAKKRTTTVLLSVALMLLFTSRAYSFEPSPNCSAVISFLDIVCEGSCVTVTFAVEHDAGADEARSVYFHYTVTARNANSGERITIHGNVNDVHSLGAPHKVNAIACEESAEQLSHALSGTEGFPLLPIPVCIFEEPLVWIGTADCGEIPI